MLDYLLPYFHRELEALRRLAAAFAEAHPKIAGRLRLSGHGITDDPHVERLLEGVAFLNARVHHRLDDDFPELTDALLGVLYPHYLAPIPSSAIVALEAVPDLRAPVRLEPGLELDTEPVHGETCRFRTAAPLTLWPLRVELARLQGMPIAAPPNPQAPGAAAVLRIAVTCAAPETTFAELGVDRLRFFLRGAPGVSQPLYHLLCGHALSVAYSDGPTDQSPVIVPASAIVPGGFAPEEALWPWPARSFSGFRLLAEYFSFPEKFLFIEFSALEGKTLVSGGQRLEIFVYLSRAIQELERAVGAETLALGCVPIVNLFPYHCESIPLSHTTTGYRVVPDTRRPAALEVWQVQRVTETRHDGTARPWRPFYRLTHNDEAGVERRGSYHVSRRQSGPTLAGSEVFLGLHDPAFNPDETTDSELSVDTLCFNRDLPAGLPFGSNHPTLRLVEGSSVITRITCLTAPTPTLRPPLREGGFWRLISHLSLGHLSVVGGQEGANALKEVLRLYDLRDSADTRAAIDALVSVTASPGVARVPGARAGAFCRGLDVTLTFEQRAWLDGSLFLLASVLDRFLGLHATANSFVRCNIALRGRPERAAAWPARAGGRVLL